MKEIGYNTKHSKFFTMLDEQLVIEDLLLNKTCNIHFGKGGYAFKSSLIDIQNAYFLCEFSNSDITRFPARIKALATYLNRTSVRGEFVVSHLDGECTIQSLSGFERLLSEEIESDTTISSTEREALIKSRKGQGKYKRRLLEVESQCRVTQTSDIRFLVASHIKPWRTSTNSERLDGNNGLLLAPHIDVLFDNGWISFSDAGDMLVSDQSIEQQLNLWNLVLPIHIGSLSDEQASYMQYHRETIFKVRDNL